MKRIVVMLVGAALMAVMMLATAMPAFAAGNCGFTDTTFECRGGGGGGGSDTPYDGGAGGNFSYDFNTGEYVSSGGGVVREEDGTGFGIGGRCTGNFITGEQDCVGNF